MKDLVIVFLIALALGSALNNYQWGPDPGDSPEASSEPPAASQSETPSGPSAINNVGDSTFEQQVLKSETPVLVDFWAPWCAPCRAMGPTIEALAKENVGRLKVVKMNIDDNPVTANNYAITGIPAFYIFKGGHVAEKIVGAGPKEELAQAINKVCGGSSYDAFASAPQPGNGASSNNGAVVSPVPATVPTTPAQLPTPLNSALSENSDVPMLDETGFDRDVIKSASPVLVFFCDSSEACDRIWPTVQSVANKVADNYRVVRVNMAAHPALAQEYFVHATPTFVIFRDGRRTKQLTGVLPEKALLSFLEVPNKSATADSASSATY